MIASPARIFVATIVAIGLIVALRLLARLVVMLVIAVASGLPPKLTSSQVWARSQSFRSRLTERHPAFIAFVASRIDPRRPAGLLLTLTVLAAVYLAALFSGLIEDLLEAKGTIQIDNVINATLGPWRTEPLISTFLWITNLGSGPSVIAAVIIATGFLWPQRRPYIIIALWVTCLGAMGTTTIGKLLIGRHRPETVIDASVTGWSFPSGHATAAMAAYGFIAYAIARALPGFRERFEVAYWAAVLISLIGFSRVFLSVHYVTDVIGGFIVGGFWLLVGFAIAESNAPSAWSERPIEPTRNRCPETTATSNRSDGL